MVDIRRDRAAGAVRQALARGRVVLLAGPRQSGKTTLARTFVHPAAPAYFDLENPVANLRWRWCIEDNWKLIVPASQNEPAGKIELYNLQADPKEEFNLADPEPARVARLRDLLNTWWPDRAEQHK